MSKRKSLTAKLLKVLVYYDQPQLVLLRKGKLLFLAVAVPADGKMEFLAVSVRPGDFELYLNDRRDLLYMFTRPAKRVLYYFDLLAMKDGEVKMEKCDNAIPEGHLPGPHLFASDHTEVDDFENDIKGIETLYLDGEWDLPELGKFQQKISDVYTFMFTIDDWQDAAISDEKRNNIAKAFLDKPFRGGSSYGSYFDDLEDRLSISDRVRLKSIEKASPGNMKIIGVPEIFHEVETLITSYLSNRDALISKYHELHNFLQKQELLRVAVKNFDVNDTRSGFIRDSSSSLSELIGLDCFDAIDSLTGRNALGTAKIVLALFRRISGAGEFFAQGRAAFDRP